MSVDVTAIITTTITTAGTVTVAILTNKKNNSDRPKRKGRALGTRIFSFALIGLLLGAGISYLTPRLTDENASIQTSIADSLQTSTETQQMQVKPSVELPFIKYLPATVQVLSNQYIFQKSFVLHPDADVRITCFAEIKNENDCPDKTYTLRIYYNGAVLMMKAMPVSKELQTIGPNSIVVKSDHEGILNLGIVSLPDNCMANRDIYYTEKTYMKLEYE